MDRCEITVGSDDFLDCYSQCPNRAKYITPPGPLDGKVMRVCGVHRNSVNKMHKRIGCDLRCKSLGGGVYIDAKDQG